MKQLNLKMKIKLPIHISEAIKEVMDKSKGRLIY